MSWTQRSILAVTPLHIALAIVGLIMVWPLWLGCGLAAAGALLTEIVARTVERIGHSRPDEAHRRIAWLLWIAAGLTYPRDETTIAVALGCAALWRLVPRDTRPVAALALAGLMVGALTWIWGFALSGLDVLTAGYVVLYGATAVPLVAFAIERGIATYTERRAHGHGHDDPL